MLKPRYSNYNLECGVDEAGRGCLAGPVTAAAVILTAAEATILAAPAATLTEKTPAATVKRAPPAAQFTKKGPTVLTENLGIISPAIAGFNR